ncbi:MAG: hypothetical protein KJ728_13730 [Alphaproteobacteria bacterium]|jgi:hypothetical protein|uniref:Uncharacterized protein n=1 Tax=Brevundimonas mediterranea TaxID=74329 RepID=A0AB37E3L0_9CAUL|nr:MULTISPECIES: hypothetical protein [Brevundimonas]MBU1271964.1 hypothetical protein [Alphaproteobacteria bacterium]OGN42585.1 MAG: hypothetical protein A2093_08525 [Caulobacterales bacterium GWE1_67_11]OGN47089.1 MAG: hypothetical protein A2795_12290 [Caulobacterales bacterium RIFCSPHIGHO2_01_FULL_67_30]OGN48033.1 MAG: hypothetical protein A3E24_02200 [Caulobacterales bacterium RIFCSPHIGHO2_12_FULL_68_13]EDX81244.1 hypothetical protein BBAL3_2401 [Brevundimonas sp. BAL3]
MALPNDNRVIIAIGAGLVIIAAVVLALIFTGGGDKTPEAPPAARGGLTVDLADAPTLEPTRELRCFVDGQFVGMATLAVCAQRNGLATDALDVGIDETGALAAAPTAAFAPPPELPPVEMAQADPLPSPAPGAAAPSNPAPAPSAGAQCLRHSGSDWRVLSSGMSLNACVQALYAGTCVRPGDAQYGRWGDTTLRLVPRRVEQSGDNSRFRTLAEQDRNCQFPGLN